MPAGFAGLGLAQKPMTSNASSQNDNPNPASEVVYVVDDEPAIQALFQQMAMVHGFRLQSFTDGKSFLDAFDPDQPGCLVLDLVLPDMTGLDILKTLSEREHPTQVVFMSGMAQVSHAVSALKLGSLDFIEKPFQVQDMVDAIQKALRQDRDARFRSRTEDDIHARFSTLTQRELEVMRLVVEGLPNKLIATRLGVSPKTVEVHRAHVMQKTAADSLAELVKMAVACGYSPSPVTPPEDEAPQQ